MRFFTSDTHFGHARIIELCNRPFADVEEMNETLIDNWNSVVGTDDEVMHLGDVALGPWAEWDSVLSRLNGHKILVVGNHDRIFAQNKQSQIDKFTTEYRKWFEMIKPWWALSLQDAGTVFLSHFPYDGDSHGGDRYKEHRIADNTGTTLVHGHTHSSEKVSRSAAGTLQIHVGVDAWDYRPVSEDEVIELIRVNL